MPVTMAQTLGLSQRGEAQAQVLPPLLVRAEKVAASVILGVHGRKSAGPGESFWQYRNYAFGDSTQRVDWRRSARSDAVYIRENEWESANTLWVWANTGAAHGLQVAPCHRSPSSTAHRSLPQPWRCSPCAGTNVSERSAQPPRRRQWQAWRCCACRNGSPSGAKCAIPQSNGKQKRAAIVLVSDFPRSHPRAATQPHPARRGGPQRPPRTDCRPRRRNTALRWPQ